MRENLEREIAAIIAEEGGIDEKEIRPDSALVDLGIDSLSALEILVAVEEKYDIRISETGLKNTGTVKEIAAIVSGELEKGGRT
jgi:acyl carrier protein